VNQLAENLKKLQENRLKKVKVSLSSGARVVCKPIQALEEDYESFVIEVLENTNEFRVGQLIEVLEEDLKTVELID
jgi:hypothetical protein